ncbi:shikimate dehydrogenase [Paenirhodobacter sp.]|uniref:shikimate dehydrogenase n=1 Tax=Paenirhodobacter sp. TaxID=1965326 RepID=UPI003B3E14F9
MNIPLAGVIGAPIGHSRSPALHGHWLRHYGLRGHYIPMEIAGADLEQVLRALPKAGFVGCNVTIPHKEAALRLADRVSDQARRIGAANTLSFDENGIFADNTDGYGFITNLRQGAPGWDPLVGPAAIIGAGGAARAIVVALIEAGCPEIRITNRSPARAEALAAEFGLDPVGWQARGEMLDGAALVVNTSAMGMVGQDPFDVPLDRLSPSAVVTDIVYTPLQTPLLIAAAARGCVTVDGLGMLLHQAVPGFERWFGLRPEVTDDLRRAVLA